MGKLGNPHGHYNKISKWELNAPWFMNWHVSEFALDELLEEKLRRDKIEDERNQRRKKNLGIY
jgi:hypothetical protein